MEEMILIRAHADRTVGPVRVILDDITSSSGEKIEQLLGIFGIIWEVADGYEESQPKRAVSVTKSR